MPSQPIAPIRVEISFLDKKQCVANISGHSAARLRFTPVVFFHPGFLCSDLNFEETKEKKVMRFELISRPSNLGPVLAASATPLLKRQKYRLSSNHPRSGRPGDLSIILSGGGGSTRSTAFPDPLYFERFCYLYVGVHSRVGARRDRGRGRFDGFAGRAQRHARPAERGQRLPRPFQMRAFGGDGTACRHEGAACRGQEEACGSQQTGQGGQESALPGTRGPGK